MDYDTWSRLCEDYNEAYWDWYYSRANAIAAAEAEIPLLEEQAAGVLAAATHLDASTCQPVTGKRLCTDFFIGQCNVGPVLGDCRGFDSAAKYSQSRFQIYINPDTKDWEMKFGGTRIVYSTCGWVQGSCNTGIMTFGDSTDAVAGISVTPNGGGFDLGVEVMTPACRWIQVVCPSINIVLSFQPDPNAVGGFQVNWAGNTSPSVGVYNQNGSVFNTMKEIPQKSLQTWGFIKGLIDALSYQMNLPEPENPNSCSLY